MDSEPVDDEKFLRDNGWIYQDGQGWYKIGSFGCGVPIKDAMTIEKILQDWGKS